MTELKAQPRMKARMKLRMVLRTHRPVEPHGTVKATGGSTTARARSEQRALEETPRAGPAGWQLLAETQTLRLQTLLVLGTIAGQQGSPKKIKKNYSDPDNKCQ